ncbi:hypothetical protein XENORESO_015965 [Xenotaenia resolanae]|uniref:Uncharacterized protein n=1 Tax=Xenotaenia resolanae TaxID=208358 RepID=A0ABV0VXG9_9TELE
MFLLTLFLDIIFFLFSFHRLSISPTISSMSSSLSPTVVPAAGPQRLLLRTKHVCPQLHPDHHRHQLRRVGLLPDLQQEHEQSIPAGNVTTFSHMDIFQHIRLLALMSGYLKARSTDVHVFSGCRYSQKFT